jgi:ribosome-binding protein aMBF1 (putative translation factor)
VTERETITCTNPKCKLVQYRTAKNVCRRCKQSTAPPKPEAAHDPARLPVMIEVTMKDGVFPAGSTEDLTTAVQLILTSRRKMSQRELAKKMDCPRTYISKCERGGAIPNLSSLEKFARAFGVSLWEMVKEIEVMRAMLTAARGEVPNGMDSSQVDHDSAVLASVE